MKLHYKSYGQGKPLIILHGLFGMGDNWRTFAKTAETDYRCILPDLRNHGRSPHAVEMNFAAMSEDIHTLMEDLDIDTTHLMGHSLGGKVAMYFALHHPEKVDKLVIADMAPKYYPPHHQEVVYAIQSLDFTGVEKREELEQQLHRSLGHDKTLVQFLLKNISRSADGNYSWKSNMPGIVDQYENILQEIENDQPFTGETLFIRGERSRYVLDEDMPAIRDLFPNVDLVTIPDAGHWVHADSPNLYSRTVLSFLGKK